MTELLDPKVDFIFKRIFGAEENKDVLLAFLNDTFKTSNDAPLTEIILVNPNIDKDALHDKQSILDIRARTSEGEQINIELQLFNRYDIEKRTLYYWSKMYEEQLGEGQGYKTLKKTITINILNFAYLPNDRYHNVFHLREDYSNIILTDDIEIHFMELAKLTGKRHDLNDGLVNWLLFLKGVQKEQWEVLAMNQPALRKAMDTLEFLSHDEEARRLYEMRQKALHDEASMIAGAREEGERNKAVDVAIKLLNKGTDISTIAEISGLSEDEINKIKNTIN